MDISAPCGTYIEVVRQEEAQDIEGIFQKACRCSRDKYVGVYMQQAASKRIQPSHVLASE